MDSERLRVHFEGHGQTHHFCICCRGELREREVQFWGLHQSLVDRIFGTGKSVKGEYDGVLHDSYFERI